MSGGLGSSESSQALGRALGWQVGSKSFWKLFLPKCLQVIERWVLKHKHEHIYVCVCVRLYIVYLGE